jgi:hypothetical protein
VTNPAAVTAMTMVDLLAEGGEARRIIDGFKPRLTRQAYLELQRSLNRRTFYEAE